MIENLRRLAAGLLVVALLSVISGADTVGEMRTGGEPSQILDHAGLGWLPSCWGRASWLTSHG